MLKSCQSCGEKCHISRGKCPNCKVQFTSKKKRPISPSKLTRKHMGPIWDGMVLKVCCICTFMYVTSEFKPLV